MRLHDRTIEQVRERAQILDLFGPGNLKRSGREFLARCPWHDDQRPSLTVSPKTNRAYCFVCARGVDAIGWLQDREGLTFTDAVLQLADRYGVQIQAADAAEGERLMQEKTERARLYAMREQQQLQFTDALWLSPGAGYLQRRGLTVETIEAWGLGWNGRRVTFPLCDPQGRVVAFTGRVLDDSKPKYKNSPNDLLYSKAEMVYGLHMARDTIARSGHVVIAEGQFDVIACWQAGICNMVAVSGSSLTGAMVERIVRTTRAQRITLVFDGDLGGRKAAERAVGELRQLVLRGELELRVLALPDGQDPADAAAADPSALADAIETAPHWVQWWLEREFEALDLSTPQGVTAGEAAVRKILQVLPNGALREYVRQQCRARLNSLPMIPPAQVQTDRQVDACRWAERRALRLYLLDPGCRPALSGLNYQDPWSQRAAQLVQLLEGMLGERPELLAPAFARSIERADHITQSNLMPLVHPIPEVRRVIDANPLGELEGALATLASAPCQGYDPDSRQTEPGA